MKIPWALTLVPGRILTEVWIRLNGRAFIVMHTGRVGSVVVGDLLSEHAQITFDHDPLHGRRLEWMGRHGPDTPWREDPRWEVMRRPWRARSRVYGVVIKPASFADGNMSWPAMLEYLGRTLRPKRIAMTRRNLLRQIISGCRALENAQWHVYGEELPAEQKLQAPPDRLPRIFGGTMTLRAALEEREAATELVVAASRAAAGDGLHLIYEDHVQADPLVGYGMVCRLMDLTPDPTARPRLRRTGHRSVRDLVSRPEDWVAALRGTRWEWMLDN